MNQAKKHHIHPDSQFYSIYWIDLQIHFPAQNQNFKLLSSKLTAQIFFGRKIKNWDKYRSAMSLFILNCMQMNQNQVLAFSDKIPPSQHFSFDFFRNFLKILVEKKVLTIIREGSWSKSEATLYSINSKFLSLIIQTPIRRYFRAQINNLVMVRNSEKQDISAMFDLSKLSEDILKINIFNTKFKLSIENKLINHNIYRIFNYSMEEGGRMYHQAVRMPAKDRSKMLINGRKVIELDYSALHLSIAYCLLNQPIPDFDLYQIEGFERNHVKTAINIMLNCDRKKHKATLATSFKLKIKYEEARLLIAQILMKHPILSNCPNGLQIQKSESDLAIAVIVRMQKQGYFCIPIHDSFIAPNEGRFLLLDAMKSEFFKMFGQKIEVK